MGRRPTGFFYTRYPRDGRAARRRTSTSTAGLLPRARHAGANGPLRDRQGLPAHRRDPAATRSRDGRLRAGERAERRRRRVRAVPAAPDGAWTAAHAASRTRWCRRAFGQDGALSALARRRAARQGAAPAARGRAVAPGRRQRSWCPRARRASSTSASAARTRSSPRSRACTWSIWSGGPHRVRVFDRSTGAPLGTRAAVRRSRGRRSWRQIGSDAVLFKTATFTEPPAWYRSIRPAGPAGRRAASTDDAVEGVAADFSECRGGARDGRVQGRHAVPLNILPRKGTEARRHATRRCSPATAATASASSPSFRGAQPRVARAGRRVRRGQPARRRRVRRGVAPRRQPHAASRTSSTTSSPRRAPDQDAATPRPSGWRSRAAATAGC